TPGGGSRAAACRAGRRSRRWSPPSSLSNPQTVKGSDPLTRLALSSVRIIAGSRKGARIFAPKGIDTRPTGDRVREAAFNLIGPVEGASVLDLFAGSGAMGLEALSRGADSAVFVESDREACRTIDRNLTKLGLSGAVVLCRDALQVLASDRRTYDLVLCDPPYGF